MGCDKNEEQNDKWNNALNEQLCFTEKLLSMQSDDQPYYLPEMKMFWHNETISMSHSTFTFSLCFASITPYM